MLLSRPVVFLQRYTLLLLCFHNQQPGHTTLQTVNLR